MTGCGCSQECCSHSLESVLKKREQIARRRPKFRRSESNRFPRLGEKWRSSKGIRSKMRLKKKGKWPIVETGYRGPKASRGLNPKGKIEILVHTPEDVEFIDPEIMAIRISGRVGRRKRDEIIARAESLGLEIVNLRLNERKKPSEEEVTKEGQGERVEGSTEEGEKASDTDTDSDEKEVDKE
ncbi:MAG: 50S ribosomal protein L32e [Candidatus Verstraetearchaeota archaeon]|nr:50S ribosomal protein L32e [Candidatus Verstraetearchaeota archaeon]